MANAERVEVELPPDLAQFVRSRVGWDSLASDAEVGRELVRQAAQHDAIRDEMRREIASGAASLRAGDAVDGDAFMAELEVLARVFIPGRVRPRRAAHWHRARAAREP
ncbi:MAG: hypothetical protein J0H19_05135 [Rhodospirillales bacterium]|nr:hypothetical protein [Rhodospirillales bacterium]